MWQTGPFRVDAKEEVIVPEQTEDFGEECRPVVQGWDGEGRPDEEIATSFNDTVRIPGRGFHLHPEALSGPQLRIQLVWGWRGLDPGDRDTVDL